jgi:hypothetical protein
MVTREYVPATRQIQSVVQEILRVHEDARKQGGEQSRHPVSGLWKQLERELSTCDPVVGKGTQLTVKVVHGQGLWAVVPYVLFYDPRYNPTNDALKHPYNICCPLVAWYFEPQLGQLFVGVACWPRERPDSSKHRPGQNFTILEVMEGVRDDVRRDILPNLPCEFHNFQPKFSGSKGRTLAQQQSILAYRAYPTDAIPEDRELMEDLEMMLRAVDRVISDSAAN